MRIAITGDTHGERKVLDVWMREYRKKAFDALIIAGDSGFVWDPTNEKEQRAIKAIDELPFQVLVVLGNHENYKAVYAAPLVPLYGGFAYEISSNLHYFQHGHVLHIGEHAILVFGGADSIDKEFRVEDRSWWKEEIPTYADGIRAAENIEKYYATGVKEPLTVITHTIPEDVISTLHVSFDDSGKFKDPTTRMLNMLRASLHRDVPITWHAGHFHKDDVVRKIDDIMYYIHYHKIFYLE